MAIHVQPQPEAIDRAELEILRRKAFAAWHRGPTATYQTWFEDAFHEGWIQLQKTLASGREVENWEGYLVESGRNYLHRMHYKGGRVRGLEDRDATLVDPGSAEPFEAVDDHAERLQRAKVVRQVLAEEFDERERQLIKLKYEMQRDDRQIADLMDISPRTVKRLFLGKRERGQPGINDRLTRYIGPAPDETLLCRSRRSQVKALVGGWTMSSARKAQIQAHLETCEGCRTFTRRALGYQMLLPPVALPVTLAADSPSADMLNQMGQVFHHTADKVDYDHATAIAGATDAGSSAAVPHSGGGGGAVAERASTLKQHLGDALATGKQQAVALHARVTGVDPSALPALRPGAVGATVASCLALGGGAYCAVDGLPNQLGAPLGLEQPAKREPEAKAKAPPEPPKV
ncbi:MAG: sigma-70 family RNA polymerase sigma factor, partial [Solirubrobacterales bacterium]|nr:sigma-70 family RNA polymerase sigma factor [Solirubrobacterales bacterium]